MGSVLRFHNDIPHLEEKLLSFGTQKTVWLSLPPPVSHAKGYLFTGKEAYYILFL